MLTILATLATLMTGGGTCAAIDNSANAAAWSIPGRPAIATTYTDMDRIRYVKAPGPRQNRAWLVLHDAEKALQETPVGPKVVVACR